MASTTGELRLATTATVATAAPEAAPLPAAQPGEPEPLAAEPPRVQRPRVLRQRGEQLRQSCEGCAKGWREALDFEKKFLCLDTWLRHFDGEPLPEPEKEEPAEVPAPAPEGAADDTAGRALTTVTDAGPDAAPNDADEKLSETAKEPPKEPPKVLPRFAKYKRLKEALVLFKERYGEKALEALVPKILHAAHAEPSLEDLWAPRQVARMKPIRAEAKEAEVPTDPGGEPEVKELSLSSAATYSLLANLFLLNVYGFPDLQKLYLSSAKAAPQKILCLLAFFQHGEAEGTDPPRTLHFQRCRLAEPPCAPWRWLPEPLPRPKTPETTPAGTADVADAADASGPEKSVANPEGPVETSAEAKPEGPADGTKTDAGPEKSAANPEGSADANMNTGPVETSADAKPEGPADATKTDAGPEKGAANPEGSADANMDTGPVETSAEAKPEGPADATKTNAGPEKSAANPEGFADAKMNTGPVQTSADAKPEGSDATSTNAGATPDGGPETSTDAPQGSAEAANTDSGENGAKGMEDSGEIAELDLESSGEGEALASPEFVASQASAMQGAEAMVLLLSSAGSFGRLGDVKTPPEEVPLWEMPELICSTLLLGLAPLADHEVWIVRKVKHVNHCSTEGPLLTLLEERPEAAAYDVVSMDISRHVDDRRFAIDVLRRDAGKWTAAFRQLCEEAEPVKPIGVAHAPLIGVDKHWCYAMQILTSGPLTGRRPLRYVLSQEGYSTAALASQELSPAQVKEAKHFEALTARMASTGWKPSDLLRLLALFPFVRSDGEKFHAFWTRRLRDKSLPDSGRPTREELASIRGRQHELWPPEPKVEEPPPKKASPDQVTREEAPAEPRQTTKSTTSLRQGSDWNRNYGRYGWKDWNDQNYSRSGEDRGGYWKNREKHDRYNSREEERDYRYRRREDDRDDRYKRSREDDRDDRYRSKDRDRDRDERSKRSREDEKDLKASRKEEKREAKKDPRSRSGRKGRKVDKERSTRPRSSKSRSRRKRRSKDRNR